MPATIEPFYPIAGTAAWVERLARAGARFIQLRIKEQPEAHVRTEIRAARMACSAHGAQLVVNDYWELALEEGADWLHLGQEDLDTADLPAIRKAGIRLGLSTHDEAELARALAETPDYIALGPIYRTTAKVVPFAPQGLERIGLWKRAIGALPLVAIGGITLERAPHCLDAGADSIAVVSDILHHPDPEMRCRDWLAATRR